MKDRAFSFKEVKRIGTTRHFTAIGQIFVNEASVMQRELSHAEQSGCVNILIDMRQVETLTSSGIRVILAAHKKMKELGGKLQIVSPSDSVKNVIGLTAMEEIL